METKVTPRRDLPTMLSVFAIRFATKWKMKNAATLKRDLPDASLRYGRGRPDALVSIKNLLHSELKTDPGV